MHVCIDSYLNESKNNGSTSTYNQFCEDTHSNTSSMLISLEYSKIDTNLSVEYILKCLVFKHNIR